MGCLISKRASSSDAVIHERFFNNFTERTKAENIPYSNNGVGTHNNKFNNNQRFNNIGNNNHNGLSNTQQPSSRQFGRPGVNPDRPETFNPVHAPVVSPESSIPPYQNNYQYYNNQNYNGTYKHNYNNDVSNINQLAQLTSSQDSNNNNQPVIYEDNYGEYEATLPHTNNSNDKNFVRRPPNPQQSSDSLFSGAFSHQDAELTFEDTYEKGASLGSGAFGEVFIGTHKLTGKEYAIKKINVQSMRQIKTRNALQDELDCCQRLSDHGHVCTLHTYFQEAVSCYLVFEYCRGGYLQIIPNFQYTECQARNCMRGILSALSHMHNCRIVHRDLKPENLLLQESNRLDQIQIIDFGFAKQLLTINGAQTLCGTPGFLAPELLERWPSYDVPCDVFSVGVLLFAMLSGYMPFGDVLNQPNRHRIYEATLNGAYKFKPECWDSISYSAKDLVSSCLVVQPKRRITASNALSHHWMTVDTGNKDPKCSMVIDPKESALQKVKAAVRTVMAINRMQDWQNDFTIYLEKRNNSFVSQITGGTKSQMTTPVRPADIIPSPDDSGTGQLFDDFYKTQELLGRGAYADVYKCVYKGSQKAYAVKHVDFNREPEGAPVPMSVMLKEEINVLKLLRGGPHIIRLYDVFEELPDSCYLVMDLMKGGDLLERIVDKEVYTEKEARQVSKILLEAVDYCHKKKICHRDIKPENLLLVEKGDDTSIKLADFGLAKRVRGKQSLTTICGTPCYIAPEIFDSTVYGYDHMADMWSVGILVFILLGGYAPFDSHNLEELAEMIVEGSYDFKPEYWKDVSQPAKDMIASMLQTNPAQRVTAEKALTCSWMLANSSSLTFKNLKHTQSTLRNTVRSQGSIVSVGTKTLRSANSGVLSIASRHSNGNRQRVGMRGSRPTVDENHFRDVYQWGHQIGVGAISVVHTATKRATNGLYAVKRVAINKLHEKDAIALQDEIATLKAVKECFNIVTLYEVYEEPDYTFLVLQFIRGGDLIDRINKKQQYREGEAKHLLFNLLCGIAYCHDRKIANRNLKPENLLLPFGSDTDVKISDFGYAKKVAFPDALQTQCGTEGYVAPEILAHNPAYDVTCDMWSLGVIMYIMLGGYRPFRGNSHQIMERTRYGKYQFHDQYWSGVSQDAKDLVSLMLTVNPYNRVTAREAVEHIWLREVARAIPPAPTYQPSNSYQHPEQAVGRPPLPPIPATAAAPRPAVGGYLPYNYTNPPIPVNPIASQSHSYGQF